jgi:hypothetical protein
MDRAPWGKFFKNNLKLELCLAGIVLVIAILLAMHPVENHDSLGSPVTTAAARLHNGDGPAAVGQASPVNQAASAAVTSGVSLASSSGLQGSVAGNTSSSSPSVGSAQPATTSPPVPTEPDVLYPIDPLPCKAYMTGSRIGCDICEAYPDSGGAYGCWARCPPGGVEMMCAY